MLLQLLQHTLLVRLALVDNALHEGHLAAGTGQLLVSAGAHVVRRWATFWIARVRIKGILGIRVKEGRIAEAEVKLFLGQCTGRLKEALEDALLVGLLKDLHKMLQLIALHILACKFNIFSLRLQSQHFPLILLGGQQRVNARGAATWKEYLSDSSLDLRVSTCQYQCHLLQPI